MPQAPSTRPAVVSRPPSSSRRTGPAGPRRGPGRAGPARSAGRGSMPSAGNGARAEHEIIFQTYFKSVGPRTYASQVKRANNGNHYVVLTEGKRDDATGEVRKTRLFVFGEDFVEFFKMLQATAHFIKANPVPDEVRRKRDRFWAKSSQTPAPKAAPHVSQSLGNTLLA